MRHGSFHFVASDGQPRGLAKQKECTQALPIISPPTFNAFLHILLITPFDDMLAVGAEESIDIYKITL